jgi:predicted metal-binding protein
MAQTASIVVVRPRRPSPVLICKKCLKRVAHGSSLKRALKSELKRRSSATVSRKPRIVATGCFGICPKRAVVLASAATLSHGEFLLLADAASCIEAAAILLPSERT